MGAHSPDACSHPPHQHTPPRPKQRKRPQHSSRQYLHPATPAHQQVPLGFERRRCDAAKPTHTTTRNASKRTSRCPSGWNASAVMRLRASWPQQAIDWPRSAPDASDRSLRRRSDAQANVRDAAAGQPAHRCTCNDERHGWAAGCSRKAEVWTHTVPHTPQLIARDNALKHHMLTRLHSRSRPRLPGTGRKGPTAALPPVHNKGRFQSRHRRQSTSCSRGKLSKQQRV